MSFIDCCRASCSFISTISHLASSFQNLKHANHLAPHFAHFCVLSGQNLLLSYVESPIVILSYSPFAKQNQTEDWQIFKSFCIEIKVLKESKYKMPLVHCAFAMYYRYLLECQWKILMQILLIAKIWIILSVRFGTLLPNIGKATTRWASWRERSKPKKIQVLGTSVLNWQKSDTFDRTIDLSSLSLDFNDVKFSSIITGIFYAQPVRCLINCYLQKELLSSLCSVLAFKSWTLEGKIWPHRSYHNHISQLRYMITGLAYALLVGVTPAGPLLDALKFFEIILTPQVSISLCHEAQHDSESSLHSIDFLKSTTMWTSPTYFQHPGNPDHLCSRGPLSCLGTCRQSDHHHSPLWSLWVGELFWSNQSSQSHPGATLNNWVVPGVPGACKHHFGGTLELLDKHHAQTDHDHEVIAHNTEKVLWLYFLLLVQIFINDISKVRVLHNLCNCGHVHPKRDRSNALRCHYLDPRWQVRKYDNFASMTFDDDFDWSGFRQGLAERIVKHR